ncbi:MAG: rod shape-determining protein MreC [Lachnospiraceae bacterium]|nr:rod shape-determining protein MreC [Candidatus Darwinimomas equi]
MKKHNNFIILLVLTVVCAIMIIVTTMNGDALSPVKQAIGTVLTPVQSVVSKLGTAVNNAILESRTTEEIAVENIELQATIDELMMENTRLEQANVELDRLRELYKLDKEYGKYEKIGARVIAKDSVGWFNEFKIDKGTDDGIAVDMNVIADGGLIGIVSETGPNYAKVRSIIDDSSRISAMAMQSGDECIITGSLETYKSGRLLLQDALAEADIKDGDKIVTSNVSSKYLPGILIGFATEISMDANNLTKSGYLVPVAEFDNIQEVLVITTLKQQ